MNPAARARSRIFGSLVRFFVGTWARLTEEAQARRAHSLPGALPTFDLRPAAALVVAAFVLIFEEYYGDRPAFERYFGERFESSRWHDLVTLGWWAGAKLLGYVVVPLALFRGRAIGDAWRPHGLGRHLRIAGGLYLAILPALVLASRTSSFTLVYPFYAEAGRSWTDLVAWEAMYAATFLAVEFFFRGFLLFALEPALGAYAIFVSAVPYCMVHFGKPVAEVAGAVGAAVILGTIAMATRSIWCGVMVHVAVAWTMDLLALARGSGFPPHP
jgi:membrane protease YdiL (CAAX protease family)